MRLLLLLICASILFIPAVALAQEQDYQVVKSDKSESFVLPYTASNQDKDNPLVYTFETPKQPSWILSIQNNLSYVPSGDSKTIIRINEPAPSEKYIEIAMSGGESRTYWVAVNTPEDGYAQIYVMKEGGWSTENPISVSHEATQGLTVTDGKRIVVDRLDLGGFAVGSLSVYGNDEERMTANEIGRASCRERVEYTVVAVDLQEEQTGLRWTVLGRLRPSCKHVHGVVSH